MRYVPNSTVGSPPGMTNPGGSPGGFASLNNGGGGLGFAYPGAYQPGGKTNPQQQQPQQNSGGGQGAPQQTAQNPLTAAPPSEEEKARFIPDVFKQPFMQGLQAAAATGSYASQALPGAGNFQAGLYSPTLNPMEQQFMAASGYLGSLGLEQALNEIGQEYALDPHNMAKNKSYYDAANQFAAQMMQTGAKLGLDRMSLATQQLPNTFNFPNQAAQYGQQSAAGYYNALEQARLGDTKFPYQLWSTYPIQGSTYVQPPAPSGGK